jgi:hypothetical protein
MSLFFDGNLDHLKDDLLHVRLDELSGLLTRLEQSNTPDTLPESNPTDFENDNSFIDGFSGLDEEVAEVHESTENEGLPISQSQLPNLEDELISAFEAEKGEPYPTPPLSPPAALLASAIREPENGEPIDRVGTSFEVWKSAFNAGRLNQHVGMRDKKPIDKARIKRLIEQPNRLRLLHRSQLPSPPSRHEDLANHPLGSLFEHTEQDHLKSHIPGPKSIEIKRKERNSSTACGSTFINLTFINFINMHVLSNAKRE